MGYNITVASMHTKRSSITQVFIETSLRCWSAGQLGTLRSDLDAVKVDLMYSVNQAKYMQHQDLVEELLSTGSGKIVGGASTSWTVNGKYHCWTTWNGLIQMRLREEFRPEQDRAPGLLDDLVSEFQAYRTESS